jgi:catechol 2,3-dioxygenase
MTTPLDPEEATAAGALTAHARIPDATTVGAVHLTVADLERSLDYYRRAIGLAVLDKGAGRASLGAGPHELLVLVEHPGAAPSHGYTGLYHFALLVPERADLARWLAHAVRERVPLTGASDHDVSEALYLRDPDHHGIEIYRDRPREQWEGEVATRLTTFPLDVQDLLAELDDPATEPFERLPAGTVMGHVHLKAASIPEIVAFYRDLLGFALTAQLGSQAAFLAAGGYHHHLGANTWESAGASPPPPESAALRHYSVVLPTETDRDDAVGRLADAGVEVEESPHGPLARDPSGNVLVLTAA